MIFDVIRESHDLQRDLCRKLTASRHDMAARQVLFLQLKVELIAHAAAEERQLYVPLLMEDGGLDASRHALHEHHEIDELLDDLSVRDKKQAGWIATAKTLSFKVRHHLKEEESKFFQVAGRLLSATEKKQLARKYTHEIERMRRHYDGRGPAQPTHAFTSVCAAWPRPITESVPRTRSARCALPQPPGSSTRA